MQKTNPLLILFAVDVAKIAIFANWVSPYANLGITQLHMCKAILLDMYLQVSCETDVTFYSYLLCIGAALALVHMYRDT